MPVGYEELTAEFRAANVFYRRDVRTYNDGAVVGILETCNVAGDVGSRCYRGDGAQLRCTPACMAIAGYRKGYLSPCTAVAYAKRRYMPPRQRAAAQVSQTMYAWWHNM